MKVIAKDEKGNEFTYDIKISITEWKGKKIVDFGFPCQYYLDDLLKGYPFTHNLYIDAGGRNYKDGSPVWVSKEDINKFLKEQL